MVYEETLRCGRVKGVAVPVPPFDVDAAAPCRCAPRLLGASPALGPRGSDLLEARA